ncbi:hypothetical protein KUV50_13315 [Membranicola marinus]|uniref:Right handed beta helix region n=1 Tax=Membranihabitans marinus TaxID=1227546 RepID=A0A953HVQ9_9BACT|nr:hypothetical protein [Membranihabitans marinus]MBY5959125.1 hypothetical protein [Membranihabitans marinus]
MIRNLKMLFLLILITLAIVAPAQENKALSQQGLIEIDNLSDLRIYAKKNGVEVKLKPGNYQIDEAKSIRFMQFAGHNSYFDLRNCRFMVDTRLFRRTDLKRSEDGNNMYSAIEISGNNVTLEGLYLETYGGHSGRQSKNKMVNIVGEDVTLKNMEVRTAGSSPWGYGSLYGLGGGVVRKMNGIRIGYPAKNVKLMGCKVHMRAMGHAIFLQETP